MSPKGTATRSAIPETIAVAVISGHTPKLCDRKSGVHLVLPKYSKIETSLKKATVSPVSATRMPSVVRIETSAARNSTPWIALSRASRAPSLAFRSRGG